MKRKKSNNLKLTSRGQYAVMAMVELVQKGNGAPVPLANIAVSSDISLSYMEQLFAGLRRGGLVKSYRGPGGGYILAKTPGEISVADILHSAEDCVPAKRNEEKGKQAANNPQAAILWTKIGEILDVSMRRVSLEEVANGNLKDNPALEKLFETLS